MKTVKRVRSVHRRSFADKTKLKKRRHFIFPSSITWLVQLIINLCCGAQIAQQITMIYQKSQIGYNFLDLRTVISTIGVWDKLDRYIDRLMDECCYCVNSIISLYYSLNYQ